MFPLTTSIHHYAEGSSQGHLVTKWNKMHLDWKGRSKTLLANDMFLYVETPKDPKVY